MKDTMIYNVTETNIIDTVTYLMNTYSELLFCNTHSLDEILKYISLVKTYPSVIVIYSNIITFCFIPNECITIDQINIKSTDLS